MVKSMVEVYQSKQVAYAPHVRHPCPKHMDKEEELYCFDCSTTVCHLCAVISHRACRKIGTVTEAAQQRRETWQGYLKQIPGLINDALESDNLKERYWKEINNNKAGVEKAIKEAAKKMHNIVTVEEAQLLRQVQGNYDNLRNKAMTFNEQMKKLKSFEMNVSSKLSSSSDFDLLVDKDASLAIDSYSQQNQAANRDYRRSCETLASVRWSFHPQNVCRVTLGRVAFSGK
ncbi:unnamed protein product [Candidula unifasciata]|uniref:B box-type domain-containing protein n=1 Tax=Candidula unifasciata TaxID=100452 RepID=A0A8S3ZQW8_9EUPU|nr:unnamed protein product [Candidula unifasciata]